MSMINLLPQVQGNYRENADLSKNTWFGVGGTADILFRPRDTKDLAEFTFSKPKNIEHMVLGLGSNILIRDGGIKGVVVKLGRNFNYINHDSEMIVTVGTAVTNYNLAQYCLENGLGGLEFIVGIPGCIGGGIAMNAGAYGNDFASNLLEVTGVDEKGNIRILKKEDFGFQYRSNSLQEKFIFTEAKFITHKQHKELVAQKIAEINFNRSETQPIKSKTGGSTFKNPEGHKAWQLIDQAGCRGLAIGGAMVSKKHCNFLINFNNANASDIENLAETVRRKVYEETGIKLEWEIKVLGVPKRTIKA